MKALWWAAKGDWSAAHEIVAEEDDARCAWVHAHLHRQEGDLANARYWYLRADRPIVDVSLETERNQIIGALLEG